MERIRLYSDEAKSLLLEASEFFTGWDDDSMLDVVCNYINEFHGTAGLREYLEGLVEDEVDISHSENKNCSKDRYDPDWDD